METTDANHINQNLIASILENESLNDNNVRIALDEIGRRIIFHPSSHPEDKVYHFNIITGKNYDGNSVEISIQVLKGSLMTHTWNTFSRFDDEYLWKYKNTDGIVCDILYIAGLNQSECSVKKGSCNWVKFREIMIYMDIASVGLCMFVTLLGHLLFTIPHFTQEGTYIVPMPATYMFNYIVSVASCPVELSPHVLTCLYYGTNRQGVSAQTEQQTYKLVVDSLVYPNGSGVQFDNHYILPRIKGNFVLQPIQSSLSALTPKKAIIRVVEIREHALSTGEDGLISLLEELVAADIDKPYVISMNRYIARDVATLIAGVCNAEPVDLLGHQAYTSAMRLIKIEHNRQFPSHKISEWNSSVFGSIDFWKTPVWGLEGHTAICSSLLTSPPGQQSEVSDSSKPSVPATTHPKARSIVPKNSMEATQLLQQSRVVNKRKPEADQSNVSKLRLLTHRNNPKQFIAKPNKPTQPIKHVLLTPGLRVKALTPAPTQTSIPKRVPKVEEQSKEIVFTVGETVFVSIEEWFTLAAPCPANDAGKLFVRGDVVMSSRNSAKFTISFPQLGPFVDDSVLTRSTQYLEKRVMKRIPAGCREPTVKELRAIFKE